MAQPPPGERRVRETLARKLLGGRAKKWRILALGGTPVRYSEGRGPLQRCGESCKSPRPSEYLTACSQLQFILCLYCLFFFLGAGAVGSSVTPPCQSGATFRA